MHEGRSISLSEKIRNTHFLGVFFIFISQPNLHLDRRPANCFKPPEKLWFLKVSIYVCSDLLIWGISLSAEPFFQIWGNKEVTQGCIWCSINSNLNSLILAIEAEQVWTPTERGLSFLPIRKVFFNFLF